ncbi:MAG TPA: acyl-CoA dehydrogenase family protein [Dehalococcoidia bacterium]|nr:acyl-CoA dehydrogenase family protein [Dehalococcoidia bacterium]
MVNLARPAPGAEALGLHVPNDIRPKVVEIRDFIERVARPIEERFGPRLIDERHHLDESGKIIPEMQEAKDEIRRLAGAAGYHALSVPAELGGGGLRPIDLLYIQEEVYRDGLRLTKEVLSWTEGVSPLLHYLTNPHVRERYLGRLMRGEVSASFAATEPGAGSDLTAVQTTARRDGAGWVLNGHKAFITGAPFAAFAQVVAQTEPGSGRQGLAIFLVDADTPGYRVGRVATTLIEDGNTADLHFDNCHVPAENLVGEVGQGLPLALQYVNWIRMRRGGMCSGLAQFCFEAALRHARQRRAFGRPIGEFEAVSWMLADIYTDLYAARSTSIQCLEDIERTGDTGLTVPPETIRKLSLMKLVNDESLYRITDRAIQVHGALGLTKALHLEKIFRVARNLRIPGGTTEIQRATIVKTFDKLPI